MVIKYKIKKQKTITPCPHGTGYKVGSCACTVLCQFCKSSDTTRHIVECTIDEWEMISGGDYEEN